MIQINLETYTFDIGKDAGEVTIAWSDFNDQMLGKLLEYGMKQKVADGHSDVKKDDPGSAKAARDGALEMIEALKNGVWSERSGRAANPVAKHARTIAQLEAQQRFAGMTVNTKTGQVQIKAGSKAEEYFAFLRKARNATGNTDPFDHKAERVKWENSTMKSERVQAEARLRAEADKTGDVGLSIEELKALGLV